MAPHHNADTLTLHDILGDPMIRECWNFNYLFDIGFIMKHFDPDVRDLVKVKIVHGFWKRDDERRADLIEAAEAYANVELKTAYIPDPFGTHHSKMLILFRHDDFAQVIIHTANMIARDWRNMTQAVWRSPLLPLNPTGSTTYHQTGSYPIGTGERFKVDLLRYLDKYENRLKALTQQLVAHDFAGIRAAFLGSAPSRQKPEASDPTKVTSFGWLGLSEILSIVPVQSTSATSPSKIVVQVSSIATLGQNPTWLAHFQSVLNHQRAAEHEYNHPKPTLNIIFPTPHEIRTSLDGYASGGSIHTKIQSPAQQKQLAYLRPHLCHWKHSGNDTHPGQTSAGSTSRREAHRGPAAPHIKTYIRFCDAGEMNSVDWAIVTSANLSKQAWGEMVNKKGEVWIQSWEVGVVVWPELFGDGGRVKMVPVYGSDVPIGMEESADKQISTEADTQDDEAEDEETQDEETEEEIEEETEDEVTEDEGTNSGKTKLEVSKEKHAQSQGRLHANNGSDIVVGLRMPYDLPLTPYTADEVPWCATLAHTEPDWKGRTWAGY